MTPLLLLENLIRKPATDIHTNFTIGGCVVYRSTKHPVSKTLQRRAVEWLEHTEECLEHQANMKEGHILLKCWCPPVDKYQLTAQYKRDDGYAELGFGFGTYEQAIDWVGSGVLPPLAEYKLLNTVVGELRILLNTKLQERSNVYFLELTAEEYKILDNKG